MKKRIFLVIVLLSIILIPIKTLSFLEGDVNGDGKVTVTDYILIRKHILKLDELIGEQLTRADVNNDGNISISDYIAIRRIILKLDKVDDTNINENTNTSDNGNLNNNENTNTSNNGNLNNNENTNTSDNDNLNNNENINNTLDNDDSKTNNSIVENVDVKSISLNKETLTVYYNNSKTLSVTVNPSNATDQSITWTSSDSSIATVSNGKITGLKEGTVTITAKSSNGKKATCKVTVKRVNKIHFVKNESVSGETLNSSDAILLHSNGHFAMIDTGLNNNTARKFLYDYLNHVGVKKLDFVLLTHAHRDHTGGMPYLLNKIPISKLYLKSYEKNSMSSIDREIFNEIERLSLEKGVETVYVDKVYKDGDTIDFQDMKIHLYNTAQNKNVTLHYKSDGKTIVENRVNDNSNSILQLINVRKYKIFLTGDFYDEKENIKYFNSLSKKSEFKNLDLLKMPHHGNKRSAFGGSKDGVYNVTAYNNFNPKYVIVTGAYCQICEYLGMKSSYKSHTANATIFSFGSSISVGYSK